MTAFWATLLLLTLIGTALWSGVVICDMISRRDYPDFRGDDL